MYSHRLSRGQHGFDTAAFTETDLPGALPKRNLEFHWGLAKTRASTALTTAGFLVCNDEPMFHHKLLRLRNLFCSFLYRVTRD